MICTLLEIAGQVMICTLWISLAWRFVTRGLVDGILVVDRLPCHNSIGTNGHGLLTDGGIFRN